jgi:hypothetical protein
MVPTSNVSTTPDKKRKVGKAPLDEPAVAQTRTVATLLNPLSATSLESNGPWFAPLDAPFQAEASLKSTDDKSRKDGPLGVSLQLHSLPPYPFMWLILNYVE